MGDQVEVDLIVKAIATGFDKLSKGFIDVEKANKDAAGALSTFGVNLNALDNPITAFAQGAKAAIDETVKWGGTIDELSRITGQSAEETSKLAVVMGDMGISTDTLKSASKSLKEQGLTPTLDTIKKLAGEYQAIQDPVERNKWGAKTLGKAYFDLSEALSKTPEQLDALGAAAEKSGRIMTEESIAAAEKYQESLAQLDDMIKGLQVSAGNVLIPTLLRAGDALQTEGKIAAIAAIEFQRMTGQIDYNEAAQRAAAVAAGDLGAAFEEQIPVVHDVNERLVDTSLASERVAEQIDIARLAVMGYGSTASDAVIASQLLNDTLEPLTGVASDLAFAMGELNTQNLYTAASAGLSDDAQYALAVQMGLVNEAAAGAKTVLDELRTKLEEGKISTGEYTTSVGLLDAAIRTLPAGQTITIEIFEQYRQQYIQDFNAENSGQGGTESGQVGGAQGDGYATGVQGMVVPPGYPNDSYRMRVQSGEVVDVWTSPQERAAAMGGGVSIGELNIYQQPGQDGRALAQEFFRQIDEHVRAVSASGMQYRKR